LVIRYWLLGIFVLNIQLSSIQSAVRRLKLSRKHEIKKNEMFRAIFRGFVLSRFRDEKKNIEHPTSNLIFLLTTRGKPDTRNLKPFFFTFVCFVPLW